jgi:hypothetical protein
MNHVRGLLGIPAEDFETLLTIITKSTSSHLRFNVLDIEVELSKIIDDQLEVKIVMENPKGEATVRFQFNGTECKSLIL